MQRVFVLDKNKKPIMPCNPARARHLLKSGKAAVYRRYPFTIILKEREGGEYQQGELSGYEVRKYLLEKFGRKCVYCGAKDVPLEVEHIIPKSRGGSNRVSNLTLACQSCNQKKDNQTAHEFGYPHVQKLAQMPLKDASAVNTTRWKLYEMLQNFCLPIELGTGGRTKYNRIVQDYRKTHWLDAACVGESGQAVYVSPNHQPLIIKAVGRGNRQMTKPDKYGFPCATRQRKKVYFGFQTGDMAKALVTSGKKAGVYVGKVTVRASGSFNITSPTQTIQGFHHRFFKTIHKSDGYSYMRGEQALLPHA